MKNLLRIYLLALLLPFVSVVFSQMPQAGRLYYIYCDNDTKQYFYNKNGELAVAAEPQTGNPAYIFRCIANGDYLQFINMADGGG